MGPLWGLGIDPSRTGWLHERPGRKSIGMNNTFPIDESVARVLPSPSRRRAAPIQNDLQRTYKIFMNTKYLIVHTVVHMKIDLVPSLAEILNQFALSVNANRGRHSLLWDNPYGQADQKKPFLKLIK
jgi:hypothetical protein